MFQRYNLCCRVPFFFSNKYSEMSVSCDTHSLGCDRSSLWWNLTRALLEELFHAHSLRWFWVSESIDVILLYSIWFVEGRKSSVMIQRRWGECLEEWFMFEVFHGSEAAETAGSCFGCSMDVESLFCFQKVRDVLTSCLNLESKNICRSLIILYMPSEIFCFHLVRLSCQTQTPDTWSGNFSLETVFLSKSTLLTQNSHYNILLDLSDYAWFYTHSSIIDFLGKIMKFDIWTLSVWKLLRFFVEEGFDHLVSAWDD